MKMTVYAGVFALAAAGLLPEMPAAFANEFTYAPAESASMAASIDVGRIHSALRLTPRQQPLWAPVEAALREIARQQRAHAEPAGFVRRISHRVLSIVLNSAAVERLAVAARPLIAVLDDEQKRAASGLAQEMGLGAVVVAALK
jgi:zinc resistance-associated protein